MDMYLDFAIPLSRRIFLTAWRLLVTVDGRDKRAVLNSISFFCYSVPL